MIRSNVVKQPPHLENFASPIAGLIAMSKTQQWYQILN